MIRTRENSSVVCSQGLHTIRCIATYDLVWPSGLMFLFVITRLAVGPMAARAPTTYGSSLNKAAEKYIDLFEFRKPLEKAQSIPEYLYSGGRFCLEIALLHLENCEVGGS